MLGFIKNCKNCFTMYTVLGGAHKQFDRAPSQWRRRRRPVHGYHLWDSGGTYIRGLLTRFSIWAALAAHWGKNTAKVLWIHGTAPPFLPQGSTWWKTNAVGTSHFSCNTSVLRTKPNMIWQFPSKDLLTKGNSWESNTLPPPSWWIPLPVSQAHPS